MNTSISAIISASSSEIGPRLAVTRLAGDTRRVPEGILKSHIPGFLSQNSSHWLNAWTFSIV
jgi:hypothetical protein